MSIEKDKDPNLYFKMRVGKGEAPLRIYLSQKDGSAVAPGSQVTIKDRRKKTAVVPRRKPVNIPFAAKKGLVTFYDMGQVKDGSGWKDLEWSQEPELQAVPHWPTTTMNIVPFNNDMDLWDSLKNEVLSVPTSQWASTYRPLGYEEIEKYPITFVNGELLDAIEYIPLNTDWDNWTEQGLEVPSGLTNFGIYPQGQDSNLLPVFVMFDTGTTRFKVTTGNTYESDAVSFTLKKGDKVFLMPQPVLHVANAGEVPPHLSPQSFDLVVGPWGILSRDFWRDKTTSGEPAMRVQVRNNPTLSFEWLDALSVDPNTRRFVLPDETGYSETGTASDWPGGVSPAVIDTVTATTHAVFLGSLSVGGTIHSVEGTLAGAVQRAGTTYYIWSKGVGEEVFDRGYVISAYYA